MAWPSDHEPHHDVYRHKTLSLHITVLVVTSSVASRHLAESSSFEQFEQLDQSSDRKVARSPFDTFVPPQSTPTPRRISHGVLGSSAAANGSTARPAATPPPCLCLGSSPSSSFLLGRRPPSFPHRGTRPFLFGSSRSSSTYVQGTAAPVLARSERQTGLPDTAEPAVWDSAGIYEDSAGEEIGLDVDQESRGVSRGGSPVARDSSSSLAEACSCRRLAGPQTARVARLSPLVPGHQGERPGSATTGQGGQRGQAVAIRSRLLRDDGLRASRIFDRPEERSDEITSIAIPAFRIYTRIHVVSKEDEIMNACGRSTASVPSSAT